LALNISIAHAICLEGIKKKERKKERKKKNGISLRSRGNKRGVWP